MHAAQHNSCFQYAHRSHAHRLCRIWWPSCMPDKPAQALHSDHWSQPLILISLALESSVNGAALLFLCLRSSSRRFSASLALCLIR
uniref:Uncharacterized protein n=1 Tax=Globodera rostochiensis TaxID=31243 RepID=A0A914HMV4_GLORO